MLPSLSKLLYDKVSIGFKEDVKFPLQCSSGLKIWRQAILEYFDDYSWHAQHFTKSTIIDCWKLVYKWIYSSMLHLLVWMLDDMVAARMAKQNIQKASVPLDSVPRVIWQFYEVAQSQDGPIERSLLTTWNKVFTRFCFPFSICRVWKKSLICWVNLRIFYTRSCTALCAADLGSSGQDTFRAGIFWGLPTSCKLP